MKKEARKEENKNQEQPWGSEEKRKYIKTSEECRGQLKEGRKEKITHREEKRTEGKKERPRKEERRQRTGNIKDSEPRNKWFDNN